MNLRHDFAKTLVSNFVARPEIKDDKTRMDWHSAIRRSARSDLTVERH